MHPHGCQDRHRYVPPMALFLPSSQAMLCLHQGCISEQEAQVTSGFL